MNGQLNPSPHYVGVDVGTGSARAGVFDAQGKRLASSAHPIRMWKPKPDFVEQSSDDIWSAVCTCVREALQSSGVAAAQVKGIGFDATCSLVVLDENNQPVTISPDEDDAQNIIVWMDHRAMEQTQRINKTADEVLNYVGGRISPEMQIPKLLWLKEHRPDSWQRASRFLDLPDFLTYRATGDDTRSLCTTVCKWTYLGHQADETGSGWSRDFFESIGLEELLEASAARIGNQVRPMGEPVGQGLSSDAAEELGLVAGTAVGVSIIDAHAGGLGMLGAQIGEEPIDFNQRLALIGGTSSCHMAVSKDPRFIDGVWGPYYSAMVPGWWLTEGGQSATGALVDHIVFQHAATEEAQKQADATGVSIYEILNERLNSLAESVDFPAALTRDLHVFPDFHGNRSPRADASLRGMISGLKLSATIEDLALLYLATIQAIAYGTRHIIDALNAEGYEIDTIFACGGGTKNPVFLREHADVTGCRVVLTNEPEAVLLGAAILGAVAHGMYADIPAAMSAMSSAAEVIDPSPGAIRRYHDAKYQVYHDMHAHQEAYRQTMGI